MKLGNLVRVKNYFQDGKFIHGGSHGVVVDIEGGIDEIYANNPRVLVEVLVSNGRFNYYSAGNLEVLSEAR